MKKSRARRVQRNEGPQPMLCLQAQRNNESVWQVCMLLTMLMDPSTARPMPRNFCTDPDSSWRQTANIAVNTGMVGCMQVATRTPDNEMPRIYINWLKNRQTPSAPTCRRSLRFGRIPANTKNLLSCLRHLKTQVLLQELYQMSSGMTIAYERIPKQGHT